MNIDERLAALAASMDVQRVNIESLHAGIHELYETVQRSAEEWEKRQARLEQRRNEDANRLRAVEEMSLRLANIVIRHEERLDALDGGG